MEARLIELEIRYTHLKAHLEELSDVMFAQQKTIDGLEKRLRELEQQSANDGMPPGTGPAAERPPHY